MKKYLCYYNFLMAAISRHVILVTSLAAPSCDPLHVIGWQHSARPSSLHRPNHPSLIYLLNINNVVAICKSDFVVICGCIVIHGLVQRSLQRSGIASYSLSHNYCEHHFFGIFQVLLYL